jgi:four helix bundle protein
MDHKELNVWKESVEMVTDIYNITKKFPKEEQFGLTNQIRRAAVSIPSNIAEGAARNSNKEFRQFLYIALGSLSELETQLIISNNLNFTQDILMVDKLVDIKKMILGLIKYLSKN